MRHRHARQLAVAQLVVLALSCLRVLVPTVHAQTSPAASDQPTSAPNAVQPPITEAERIIRLKSLLESDTSWRATLSEELKRVEAAYEEASAHFTELDQRSQGETVPAPGEAPVDPKAVDARALERNASRDRFDLLIQRRKALRQQLATLDEKITLVSQILADLLAGRQPGLKPVAAPQQPATDSQPDTSAGSQSGATRMPSLPGMSNPLGIGTRDPDPTTTPVPADDDRVVDMYVAEARSALNAQEAELRAARAGVSLIDNAIDVFTSDLESAKQMRAAAESEERAATEAITKASTELNDARIAEADAAAISAQEASVAEARIRLTEARNDLARHVERVQGSEATIANLRKIRAESVARAEQAEAAVASAKRRLAFAMSPFSPHRLLRWLIDRGPRIAFVVTAMVATWLVARLLARKLLTGLIRHGKRGSEAARQERAETLRRVFESGATVAIVVIGILAALSQAGIDVTVLLGGAAVLGAAVAFGSQNLIKDYFSGLMVLMENQYSVGNVIKLGEVSGVVEDITLRMTVLRDLEGIVHFIPHSQVGTVSNMTYGWSRAVFDIGVSYNEDVDKVMLVLMDLAQDLRNDEIFGPYMLGEPEMLGVDALGDSAVVIKFFIKTRPLRQWLVKREMLRRIKSRFDELGIEIPFPHRTIYHRGLEGLRQADNPGTHDHPPGQSEHQA